MALFPLEDIESTFESIFVGGGEVHVVRLLWGKSDILWSDGSQCPNDEEDMAPALYEECLRFNASKTKCSESSSDVSLSKTPLGMVDVFPRLPLVVLLENRMLISS